MKTASFFLNSDFKKTARVFGARESILDWKSVEMGQFLTQ